jgi:hypothetical protein
MARSRNHYYNGSATLHFLCIVELHGAINSMKMLNVAQSNVY